MTLTGERAGLRGALIGAALLAVLAVLPTAPAAGRGDTELLGAAATTLKREPLLRPATYGSDPIEKLRYGNPTEGIDLAVAPIATPEGDAEVSLPMSIPAGRGGVQPDLTLNYSSGEGTTWLGTGWDLDLGSVAVDTSYGAPRYDKDLETETYLLDGDQLAPTAVRVDFEPRVKGARADFTRRVDDKGDLIIRHGTSPTNYWWEVRDKIGNVRWYGGTPDFGGPDGTRDDVDGDCEPDMDKGLDENAVLRTKDGNIVRWGLSAMRDVGVNMMRVTYDKVAGRGVGSAGIAYGEQLYPSEVLYTGRAGDPDTHLHDDPGEECYEPEPEPNPPLTPEEIEDARFHPEDPAWQVRFIRDGEDDARRKDIEIDASTGAPVVTSDLLRRIEVRTGPQQEDESLRPFTTVVKAFDLHYEEGAFGKSLLSRVDQIGSDGRVFAHNDLDYFDEVSKANGDYDGFADEEDWDTGHDGIVTGLLNAFGSSALGSSESTSGDVNAFVGFNPTNGNKNLSIGGSLSVNGGGGEALIELLDIDGDGLPDKVFRDGGDVKFRLNTSGPRGGTTFGDAHEVLGSLSGLSTDWDIGLGGGPEAYVSQFAVQFSTALSVAVAEGYFSDVNADGLPDYVRGGRVYFNRIVEGVPYFADDSAGTKVPIGTRDFRPGHLDKIDQLETVARRQSPVQDTVRRWVAPYKGTVDIDAPVTFDPPNRPYAPDDGVDVSIQRGGDILWHDRLTSVDHEVTPTGVGGVHVDRGQAVYFRLQTGEDATNDRVRWDPKISYTGYDDGPDGPGTDVNGRSERSFRASTDFTTAGRPAVPLPATLKGTLHFEGTFTKTKKLTDDVTVVVQKNGEDIIRRRIEDTETFADGLPFSADIPVAAPTGDRTDMIGVRIETDTDVDVGALEFRPRLFYTQAEYGGQPIAVNNPDGTPKYELPVVPYIDLYPTSSAASPPDAAPTSYLLQFMEAHVITNGAPPGTEVTFSVKSRDGLVAKKKAVVNDPDAHVDTLVKFDQDDIRDSDLDGPYWIELSFPDPASQFVVDGDTHVSQTIGGPAQDIPHTRRFAGVQGYFPLPYRGWGYAGYSAPDADPGDPIDENAFVFRRGDFPEQAPTGWSRPDYPDPARGRAFPFTPHRLKTPNGTFDVWRGSKDTTVGGATFAQAARRGIDDPEQLQDAQPKATDGATMSAPRIVGITGPEFAFNASAFQLSASIGGSPSFGLQDYTDVNGDGFPDVVTPDRIEFTGPRGDTSDVEGAGGNIPSVVRSDTTLAVGGGFAGSAIAPKADASGQAASGTDGGTGRRKGKRGRARHYASQALESFDLGAAIDLSASFTNEPSPFPGLNDRFGGGASDDDGDGEPDDQGSTNGVETESDLADVNGDGLLDRISAGPAEVRVRLGLGYGFDDDEIVWARDTPFESGETYSGSIEPSLGFEINKREYAGGLSYNEGVSMARTTWDDVNGDGILDQMRKDDGGSIRVRFGTGSGLAGEVDYGDWSEGTFDLAGQGIIPSGEQVVQDRSRALGGGLDFTFGIGPLCPPTPLCWIVVNPGIHASHEVGNTTVDLVDMDGDGAPESVTSLEDSRIVVRRNRVGRTNLLRSVTDSLGGTMRLNYRREGNTRKDPDPKWVLASVESGDGHTGDGVDTTLRTFDYEDGVYDPLEKQSLGFGEVTETTRSFKGDGNVFDDPVLRTVERSYRNATVFDAGLLTKELVKDPGGRPVREELSTWETAELENAQAVNAAGLPGNERLSLALSPRRTKLEQRWFDADGSVGEETWNDFRYDELGTLVWQHDEGEPEDDHDDLTATTTPSTCTGAQSRPDPDDPDPDDPDGSSLTELAEELYGFECGAKLPDGGRISPLFDTDRCATWTSLPAVYEVVDGDGRVVRHRDGSQELCDNSSVTKLVEDVDGSDATAVTELDYDEWGSYDDISYPENAAGEHYSVHYEYDGNTHAQVASTADSHGLRATVAFSATSGRPILRRGPTGTVTRYAYDAVSRLTQVKADDGSAQIDYDYRTAAHEPAVIARHRDPAHTSDPIETVAISDARGRIIQTKRDATVSAEGGPQDVMVVEGVVDRDAFGRVTTRYARRTQPRGTAHVFDPVRSAIPPLTTSYDRTGRVKAIGFPDGTTTSYVYGFGADEGTGGAQVFRTTVTDQAGKVRRTSTDVRGNLLASEQRGTEKPGQLRRTRYGYDALGALAKAVEPGGGTTTHAYDRLGRRTATRTPDGGLVEHVFDTASNEIAKITPRTRAANARISYAYDQERLTGIDYPDAATPDVSYAYGAADAGSAAGRVVRTVDGGRDRRVEYDGPGRVTKETDLMKVPGYQSGPGAHTYTTTFAWDGLGRLSSMTYPDGEKVANGYDSGGLLNRVDGSKKGRTYRYVDTIEYDLAGARRLQENGNGTKTTASYDPSTRRLTRQVTTTPAREIQDLGYTYDPVGNVSRLVNDLPDPVASLKGGPGYQNYSYDDYHRLTGADGLYRLPNGKQREYTYAVGYDEAGDITSKDQLDRMIAPKATPTTVNATTASRSYAYDPAYAHRVRTSGARRFTYDGDGNLTGWTPTTGSEKRTLTYDTADRLITATDGPTVQTTYDTAHEPAITTGPGGTIAFVNRYYTVSADNAKRTKKIYAGPDLLLTKKVDDKNLEDVQRWLHTDLQGSVNVVTDAKALVTEHSEYFPSGETWIAEDVSNGTQALSHDAVPYQFAGGYTSDVGRLVQYGRRWYDPRDAIFSAPDPLLVEQPDRAVDDAGLLGAYTYAQSNPLKFVDPAGTDVVEALERFYGALYTAVTGFAPAPSAPTPPPVAYVFAPAPAAPALTPAQQTALSADIDAAKQATSPYRVPLPSDRILALGEKATKLEEVLDKFGDRPLLSYSFDGGKLDISVAPFLNNVGSFSVRNQLGNARSAFQRVRRRVKGE